MSMSKMHFELIAEVFRSTAPTFEDGTKVAVIEAVNSQRAAMIDAFARALGNENGNFDAGRFRVACNASASDYKVSGRQRRRA